jgi:hypothetical protein
MKDNTEIINLIKDFLYSESATEELWFKGINALYCKTNANDVDISNSQFSENTLKWITKQSKLLGEELSFLNESEKKEAKLELNKLKEIKKNRSLFNEKRNLLKWHKLIEAINEARTKYINSIRGKKLDYILISEAPMLNYHSKKFLCNYIFGENEKIGSYRKVPYEAFNGEKENPTGVDLIEIFKNNKVGFFDLIPIPLPKIDTELRRLWSQDDEFKIEGLPRTMFFLKLAFENFMTSSGCNINESTKVILMMPPNTAMGIISFYLTAEEKLKEGIDERLKQLSNNITIQNTNMDLLNNQCLAGVPVRLHRQIVMNGSGGPDLKLFKHALNA